MRPTSTTATIGSALTGTILTAGRDGAKAAGIGSATLAMGGAPSRRASGDRLKHSSRCSRSPVERILRPVAGTRPVDARPPAPRLRRMPGIDGLRAVAVAAVFLYHANVSWMPGGFLGVDVFFVISGYLITSLLIAEFQERGRIALCRFWVGRARRLAP